VKEYYCLLTLLKKESRLYMKTVQQGDTITVHYTGKLKDGRVFDSSREKEPFKFTIGANQVIQGFEESVIGMQLGQIKTITIEYAKAYGAKRQDLIVTLPKTEFPPSLALKVGQHLQLQPGNGQRISVVISEITDKDVTVDGNHPLAEKDLVFDIEIIEIL
jgi:peptidylprolyl isomerase